MVQLFVGFEWHVDDAGYQLGEPRTSLNLQPFPTIEDPDPAIIKGKTSPTIIRKGGTERMLKPLELRKALFQDFAELDGSEAACIDFAGKFGYLGFHHHRELGERLVDWRYEIQAMGDAIELSKRNPHLLIGHRGKLSVDLAFVAGEGGRPSMQIEPSTLIDALWVQFAATVSVGQVVRSCNSCGKWFPTGPGARRSKSRFCDDQCRSNYHNRRRMKAKL